jgi:hypothetical protein
MLARLVAAGVISRIRASKAVTVELGHSCFDAASGTSYHRSMSDGSNYLDPDRPEAARLSAFAGQHSF